MVAVMLLILILLKLSEQTNAANVSSADFYADAFRLHEPLSLVRQQHLMWLLGSVRYQYTVIFQGLVLYVNSFKPLAELDVFNQLKIVTW